MIKGVFIINSNGKPRVIKCYEKLVRALSPPPARDRLRPAAAVPLQPPRRSLPAAAAAPLSAPQNEDQQQAVVREIFSLLAKRSDTVCNFLEGGR